MSFLRKLLKDKKGATAIEYGLIAALIAIVIIAGANALGTNLGAMFNGVAGQLSKASGTAR